MIPAFFRFLDDFPAKSEVRYIKSPVSWVGNIYLADRANRDGECWPAIPTIARELKLSQSTVRRALQDLRKAELLETEQRYRAKGGKSSLLFHLKKI